MVQLLERKKPVLLEQMSEKLKGMFTPKRQQRAKRMASLMAELAKNTTAYRFVNDLSETTHLGDTVLPLLADLKKRALVEQQWLETKNGPQLAYRLTAEGLKEATKG
jgi:DNA-binding PadR family transcriptional regulator